MPIFTSELLRQIMHVNPRDVEYFKKAFPNGLDISNWSKEVFWTHMGNAYFRKIYHIMVTSGVIPAWSHVCCGIEDKDLSYTRFEGITLTSVSLCDNDLRKTHWNRITMNERVDFKRSTLDGARFAMCHVNGRLRFKEDNLNDINLTRMYGDKLIFEETDASEIRLTESTYHVGLFHRGTLEDLHIVNSRFLESSRWEHLKLPGLNLANADLGIVNIHNVVLSDAKLTRVSMEGVEDTFQGSINSLRQNNVIWQDCNLVGVKFNGGGHQITMRGCKLHDVTFVNCKLSGVMDDCELTRVTFHNCDIEDLHIKDSCERHCVSVGEETYEECAKKYARK